MVIGSRAMAVPGQRDEYRLQGPSPFACSPSGYERGRGAREASDRTASRQIGGNECAGHRDKVAVITGGANGIGQAFARRLAEDGVHIVVADLALADATVKLVQQAGRDALACRCDVTAPDSVAALASEVERRFGRCDILINCAGISSAAVR